MICICWTIPASLGWNWFMIFLMCCWIQFANILLWIFALCSLKWLAYNFLFLLLLLCPCPLWDKCNTGFIEWVRRCFFLFFLFCGKFEECWYWFFFEVLVEFSSESVRTCTFTYWDFFIAGSVSLHGIHLFRWLMSSWFNCRWSYLYSNLSISSRFSNLFEYRFSK
jgi:hypothetical protein